MDVVPRIRAVLLDLDGVLVHEANLPRARRELLLLHRDLPAQVLALHVPVAVLTHRSRREAQAILQSLGLGVRHVGRVFAAEDLFGAAWRQGGVAALWTEGLKKSGVLAELERELGTSRQQMAFVDDRLRNLDDLLETGLGLALHAPSAFSPDGDRLTSFDFGEAVKLIARWPNAADARRLRQLAGVDRAIEPWQRSGVETRRESRHLFNGARTIGRNARDLIRGRTA